MVMPAGFQMSRKPTYVRPARWKRLVADLSFILLAIRGISLHLGKFLFGEILQHGVQHNRTWLKGLLHKQLRDGLVSSGDMWPFQVYLRRRGGRVRLWQKEVHADIGKRILAWKPNLEAGWWLSCKRLLLLHCTYNLYDIYQFGAPGCWK